MPIAVIVILCLALVYDFLNGFRDSSSIVATLITSGTLSPRRALAITAIAEFIGPLLFGVAVAKAIGDGLVQSQAINSHVVLATLLAAILWNLFTWYTGTPSSSSHALVGGILGAAAVQAGPSAIQAPGLIKVLSALFLAPLLGLLGGFLFMRLVLFLCRNASLRVNWYFRRGQLVTALALALSHGANDAQKTMGMITLGLVTLGVLGSFQVLWWVVLLSAAGISLGTLTGSWNMIKTLGGKLYRIRPVHAFSSQTASTVVVLGAALLGGPVSLTQVVSSSILGVGAAERINKVRWGVAGDIARAWLLTIPASALIGAGLCWLFSLLRLPFFG